MRTPPIATIPVSLIYPSDDIDDVQLPATVIVSDALEAIDLTGGVLHGRVLQVTGPDLVAAADALRRLADRITTAVIDARDARADADRHDCIGCAARLEPDELICGADRCERLYGQDLAS